MNSIEPSLERAMTDPLSDDTQTLLDSADRAIARGRDLVEQTRKALAECDRKQQVRDMRRAFRREIRKTK
jgi:hypothetical protein